MWKKIAIVLAITLAFVGLTGCTQIIDEDINHTPEIVYASPRYDMNYKITNYYNPSYLVTKIRDKDGDELNVQFWLRNDPSSGWTNHEWKGIGNYLGFNGTYSQKLYYLFNKCIWSSEVYTQKIYRYQWKVTASDGKEMIEGIYSFWTTCPLGY